MSLAADRVYKHNSTTTEPTKHLPHVSVDFKLLFRQQSDQLASVIHWPIWTYHSEPWLSSSLHSIVNFSGELLHCSLHYSRLQRCTRRLRTHELLMNHWVWYKLAPVTDKHTNTKCEHIAVTDRKASHQGLDDCVQNLEIGSCNCQPVATSR